MNIYLWIIYGLLFTSLLLGARLHGSNETGKNNFWATLISTILTLVLVWGALGWKLY